MRSCIELSHIVTIISRLTLLSKNSVCVCNRCTLCSSPSDSLETKSLKDVYESLWENNKCIASETIEVDFLQEMQNGSLQAERYVSFTMQDINYILNVTEMLKEMSTKVILPVDLRNFMIGRYSSYKKYSDLILNQFFFTVRKQNKTKETKTKISKCLLKVLYTPISTA